MARVEVDEGLAERRLGPHTRARVGVETRAPTAELDGRQRPVSAHGDRADVPDAHAAHQHVRIRRQTRGVGERGVQHERRVQVHARAAEAGAEVPEQPDRDDGEERQSGPGPQREVPRHRRPSLSAPGSPGTR